MKKLRIGILDFYNIQQAQKSLSNNISRPQNALFKKSRRSLALLTEAVKKLHCTPVIYRPEDCQMIFDHRNAAIYYKGRKIKGCDVLIPRINVTSNVELEISIIKQFQLMGIPTINKYKSITHGLNKLLTLQELSKANIPIPKTIIVRKFEYLDKAIELVGGYPVVIKSIFGTHGKGVALIESKRSLLSALDVLWKYTNSAVLLIQEYISDAQGIDYRALVIGNKVVASMKRIAPVEDFRSNLNIGGKAEKVELTSQEKELALRAAKALELDTCGVDILRTKNGPIVMEINPCAGLVGITQVTAIDIPLELVRYAISTVHNIKS